MSQNVEYLVSDDFTNSGVFHGFFTRKGGVSSGVYEGLNCGLGSEDNIDYVSENRGYVAQKVGVSYDRLLSISQVHGSKAFIVEEPWPEDERPHADALVCDKPGIAISILTADCAPVLFMGFKEDGCPVIGAAHAGWQGALHAVIENTLDTMKKLGARKESLKACVGPCISQKSYEVGNDFMLPFLQENENSKDFFMSSQKEGHLNFDLSGYCVWRMERYGLKKVLLLPEDTYKQEEKFYSYRRATHRNEKECGRQISVISIL